MTCPEEGAGYQTLQSPNKGKTEKSPMDPVVQVTGDLVGIVSMG